MCSSQVNAGDFKLSVQIPVINVAEYHRPYVAIWIANPDQSVAMNLAVWYDLKLADAEGSKWLKDIRQWWRRTGRTLEMPADGIAGATRAQGTHEIDYSAQLAALPDGEYRLFVEAVREVGGREMLDIPFAWPPRQEQSVTAKGETELGTILLTLTP
ncbi:MAG: DUF2271 domain-containing protein [Pseudohongiella sp.]|nr:DUF2271 domain-containing protein [Pseudohongiella sp.]